MPETSVPVTTVPKPFTENTRSMGRRKWPAAFFSGTAAAIVPVPCADRRGPRRSTELTGTIGAPSRNDPGDQFLDLQPHQAEDVGIHQVRLGERDDAARDAEQAADVEMLARLRLDRFVGGDHEQHQVDAADAGQHVLDEALVPGHVDEAQPVARASIAGARSPRSMVMPRRFSSSGGRRRCR